MNGLMYSASFENVAVGSVDDNFFELTLGNAAIAIHFIRMTCDITILFKMRVALQLLTTASSGGTALSEVPLQRRNTVAAQTTVETDTNAGIPGATFAHRHWNQQTAFIYHPAPKSRIILDSTQNNFIVRSVNGVSRFCSGKIIWEEL